MMATIHTGDIIRVGFGIDRALSEWVVHDVHEYPGGDMSLRARPLSNPRAVDWSLFVRTDEPTLEILARGIARIDHNTRSMLP